MSQSQPSQEKSKRSLFDWLQTIALPIVLALFFRFGPVALPEWVSISLGVALVLTFVATAIDTTYPYVKGWRQKRKVVVTPSQREDFRAFIMEVKTLTETELWQSLADIVREPDSGKYASMVFALLSNLSITLGRIYTSFDPSKISRDLLENYKERLNRLHSEHGLSVQSYSENVTSHGELFTGFVREMDKFLLEIRRDMVIKPQGTV